ncbi:MAG: ABC transporter ATP-binding protein/permease [Bacillales bacterium]|nr:ABC transporter ATP-binding protein/permease [Bacillales bacterium]
MADFAFKEEKLPSKLNFKVWLKIGKYALKQYKLLILCLIMTLFVSFYDSSFIPLMNASAIKASELMSGNNTTSIFDLVIETTFIFNIKASLTYLQYMILFIVMILVRSVAIFVLFYFQNIISMRIMVDLRRDSFRKLQELPFSYFDKNSSGWLIARMQNDTSSIGDLISWDVNAIIWALFDLTFTFITMFSINWLYSLVVLASLPIVIIVVPLFEKEVLLRHRKARNAYSYYVGYLAETIDGAKTIKTLSSIDTVKKEADEITTDIKKKRFRAHMINGYVQPILSTLSSLTIALIIFLGLKNVGSLDKASLVSTIILFVGFVSSIYNPLQNLSEVFSEIMAGQAGAEKLMQLIEEKVTIVDTPEVIAKYGTILNPKKENYINLDGDIEFSHVSFSYNEGVEIIHDLNLKIDKGTSLAIVGETGSGKTTTVNLLCRFYEPSKGHVYINNIDYKDIGLGCLRSSIGYVQQNPYVFSGTYLDNIIYGRLDATLEDARNACKIVGIDEYIMSTPNGYNTYLPTGGGSLSQGQKQLISFARAILKNPAILILDEATSNIDPLTEVKLQEALMNITKGRTSIVIAHRLSTIVSSDRIIVFDKGKIVEDGNHETLLSRNGIYKKLYNDQFASLSIDEQFEVSKKEEQIKQKLSKC